MSYLTSTGTSKKVQIANLSWGGSAALNSYCDFSVLTELPTSFVSSLTNGNTEINLPAGHYFAQAFPDYTRSASTEQIRFQFELDGSLIDHFGQSDIYLHTGSSGNTCDNAEAVFSVSTTAVLKIKVTQRDGSGTFTINSANSYVCLWRTEQ